MHQEEDATSLYVRQVGTALGSICHTPFSLPANMLIDSAKSPITLPISFSRTLSIYQNVSIYLSVSALYKPWSNQIEERLAGVLSSIGKKSYPSSISDEYTTDVIDTSGKVATGVVYTGGAP
jgi:hypothetical protein